MKSKNPVRFMLVVAQCSNCKGDANKRGYQGPGGFFQQLLSVSSLDL